MPSKAAQQASEGSCKVDNVYREWMDAPAVRLAMVEKGRLFQPKKVGEQLKICIKDAVLNKHVLIPLLKKMASTPEHPIPYLKPLAREPLSCLYSKFCHKILSPR